MTDNELLSVASAQLLGNRIRGLNKSNANDYIENRQSTSPSKRFAKVERKQTSQSISYPSRDQPGSQRSVERVSAPKRSILPATYRQQ